MHQQHYMPHLCSRDMLERTQQQQKQQQQGFPACTGI
jgi:hypothetical protein